MEKESIVPIKPTPKPEAPQSLRGGDQDREIFILHTFAILDDLGLDKLSELREAGGRSTEQVLEALAATTYQTDYKIRSALVESLRQIEDEQTLRGKSSSPEIQEALKKQYEPDQYAEALQAVYVNEIPKDDPEILAKLFLDEKFSEKGNLLSKLDDSVREATYKILKGKSDPKVLVSLIGRIGDLKLKSTLLEDFSAWILTQKDERAQKIMEEGRGELSYLKRDVGQALVVQKNHETLYRLLENGTLTVEDLGHEVQKMEFDDERKALLPHVRTWQDAARILKFVKEKDGVMEGAELSAYGSAFRPEEREILIDVARRLAASFDHSPIVHVLGNLKETPPPGPGNYGEHNKFVIGLGQGEEQMTIAWSNTDDYPEHKDQVKRLNYGGGEKFQKALCSGGSIKLASLPDGRTQVIFSGWSGTYGPYNQTLLESFKDALQKELEQDMGKKVEVVIAPAGYQSP